MNNKINFTSHLQSLKNNYYLKQDKSKLPHFKTQNQLQLKKHDPSCYLDIQISPSHSEQHEQCRTQLKQIRGRSIVSLGFRRGRRQEDREGQKEKKEREREREKKAGKRLIIQGMEDDPLQLQKESNSFSLIYQQRQHKQVKKISSSSYSQKKNRVHQAFHISTPPKKMKTQEKELSFMEETKCELIKNMLRRYKDNQESLETLQKTDSPSITSVKLKYRRPFELPGSEQRRLHGAEGVGGFGRGKLSRKLYNKKYNKNIKINHHFSMIDQELSPWEAEEEH